ncbi:MAG: NAD(P)/FAD-dependent oxidoreductase [Candidatus Thorarchaeota archaeon]|jgi:glycine/D-amino acid oxidase-like deaminating enzyme
MSVTTKKYSFWWDHSPPDFVFQPQLPSYADIVIVGAGFAGISTAYWLLRLAKKAKKKGLRILLLDEAPYAGFKATGRMNGSIYLGSNHSAQHMATLLGHKTAEKLYRYSNHNNASLRQLIERGIDCDLEFNGGLRMASTAKEAVELDDSVELLRKWDYPMARFDHDQSQHVIVSSYTKGSLFIPGEGMFDPFAFVNKLARILRKNGVWVVYNTRILVTDTSPAYGPQLHLANGHVMTAGKIVHTTINATPEDQIKEHVVRRREQVVRTEPLSMDLDDMPLPLMPVELNGGLDSVRIHDGAVIITGGKAGLKKDPELNVTNDTGFNEQILGQLDKTMVRHFPITNHMDVSHQWTYVETEMDDGLPVMGEIPDSHGHYVNIAHGRNKFGLAFLGARNIAERILRIKMSNAEFKIFDPKRFVDA